MDYSEERFSPAAESEYPVSAYVDSIAAALAEHRWAVVKAETGAGKTTIVPLRLLGDGVSAASAQNAANGTILMVQPRRVAARSAARRIADLLGEPVGSTVGYVTRADRQASPSSRLIIMTEGVLVRRLVGDPLLAGVSTVIFDEFHERSLDADLAFAMSAVASQRRRELGLDDLGTLVMSATINTEEVARYLQRAHGSGGSVRPVFEVPGRSFPVTINWAPTRGKERLDDAIVRSVQSALDQPGDVLVFLPGLGEIRGLQARLSAVTDRLGMPLDVRALHGSMSAEEQDFALWGERLGRKVILATNVAETSLTVEGIGAVVDSGQARRMRYDAARELNRLKLGPVSRASADQRSGRAGRLGPGVAYRCWSKMEHAARPAFSPPEIRHEDLASLVLTMAEWTATAQARQRSAAGTQAIGELEFLTEPPKSSVDRARTLLFQLGAIDDAGTITEEGRRMAALPLHPRLARMVIDAAARGDAYLACVLAAILSDRDVLRPRQGRAPTDLRIRVRLVADPSEHHPLADLRAVSAVRAAASDLLSRLASTGHDHGGLGLDGDQSAPDELDLERVGELVAAAFPDRIANAQGSLGRFRLEGTSAWIPNDDDLRFCPIVAVAEADPRKKERRIILAAPLI